jgi:hypothetical protein
MGKFGREELERAFRHYWRTGAVGEDWDGFAECFIQDALYVEHVLGTRHGREEIRAWLKPVMEEYCELYTAYEWHVLDEERDRIVVCMQNRRDHPAGEGTIDFPGVTILHYAGDGLFDFEEDYWSVPGARKAMAAYRQACEASDPEHPQKRTRQNWGDGPAWTRGARSWFERATPSRNTRGMP